MASKKSNSDKILFGALLGGLTIGAAALFLSSKTGKDLTKASADKLQDVKKKAEDLVSTITDKTQNVAGDISEISNDYSEKIHDFALEISKQIKGFGTDENKEKLSAFLIGGVVGSLVGAGVVSYVTADSQNKENVFANLGVNANNIKIALQEILKAVDQKQQQRGNAHNQKTNVTKDTLDFVASGLQLWQNIQSRRQ